jgi:NUDIX domain-containing protein
MKEVAKVLIRSGENYIFSRKRAPGHDHKDNKLEMLGGTLEPGESPFTAMVREAAEEETSGALARELKRQSPEAEVVVLSETGVPEPQHVFRITIAPDVVRGFEPDEEESSRIEPVLAEVFDSPEGLRGMRSEFTPKTRAILRAMGREI